MGLQERKCTFSYRLRKLFQHICIFVEFIPPFLAHLIFRPLGRLIYRHRCIWLFSERGTDARDNAFHLYRFVRENHPEIEAYYVISKSSSDRERLLPYGNLVNYRSITHRLMFYGAKLSISTHILNSAPDYRFQYFVRTRLHRNIIGNKEVFLQHGVTKDDMPFYYKEATDSSLFICGAKPEYDFISSTFHYAPGEVCYTGFPRFDQLHNTVSKDQILIMPTWRSWLIIGLDASRKAVQNSQYARSWNELLNAPELGKLAETYHKEIVFYPHHEMQKYLDLFSVSNPHVILADHNHYDVQQLLKDSELLITDYSSVFFDFSYMRKPVLYYQFDKEQFFTQHYQKGYFDYRRDGFGEVVTDKNGLFSILEEYLKNKCQMKPVYKERVNKFFPLHDTNNCQRVYDEIVKL